MKMEQIVDGIMVSLDMFNGRFLVTMTVSDGEQLQVEMFSRRSAMDLFDGLIK